jgi:hypothetical protein
MELSQTTKIWNRAAGGRDRLCRERVLGLFEHFPKAISRQKPLRPSAHWNKFQWYPVRVLPEARQGSFRQLETPTWARP